MKIWKVILAALVIFSAGAVTGALTAGLKFKAALQQPPPPGAPRPAGSPRSWHNHQEFLAKMEKQLELTPEQSARIGAILKESRERMNKLWDQVGPKMHEEMTSSRQLILKELNPEQQKKFEEIFKPRGPRRSGEKGDGEDRKRDGDDRKRGPESSTDRPEPAQEPSPARN